MNPTRIVPGLLALASLAAPRASFATDPARAIVVQLSAVANPTGASLRPLALETRVAARFAALGLTATRTLGERLAPGAEPALPELFAFHPERIVLAEAPDSALAANALRALAGDPLVDWAEPVVTRRIQLASYERVPDLPSVGATLDSLPDDPLLRAGYQYGLWNLGPAGPLGGVARADVHAIEGWRISTGDNALRLAVADTGIDPDQPELGGLMPDGSPRIVDALNVTGEAVPAVIDSFGHGTPVAGVMAARTNDGPHFNASGVAGVCGGDGAGNAGCRIVPIKIAPGHSGETTDFDIAAAILHAVAVGARAMNLSFAGDSPSHVERLALQDAITHGCVVVCAAGNQGFNDPTQPLWPSAYAADGLCIGVGASDSFDQRATFSSTNLGLDLVAPGVNVWTTFMSYPSWYGASYPGYVAGSGTSFAAPFVTGAVGLLAAARPELADTDFQRLIRESAHDLPPAGPDPQTGWGRLDVASALAAARPSLGVWHDEVAADSFAAAGSGVLHVGERSPGTMAAHLGWIQALRVAAYATVAVPDSFLDSLRAWPRVGGTFAARGDFDLSYFAPWAEVVDVGDHHVTLRGYLYCASPDSCGWSDDAYVPLAPSNVRFGFTVLGRVDRPPAVALLAPAADTTIAPGDPLALAWTAHDPDTVTRVVVELAAADGARATLADLPGDPGGASVTVPCLGPADQPATLRVTVRDERGHRDATTIERAVTLRGGGCSRPVASFALRGPTVFHGALAMDAPGAGEVCVLDATGRLVRRLRTRGGPLTWNGDDERGRTVRAGVFWLRFSGAAGVAVRRAVRLGP